MATTRRDLKEKASPTVNEALGYTDEDFQANRAGHLSTYQRRELSTKRVVLGGIIVPIGLLLAFLVYTVLAGVVMITSIQELLAMLLLALPVIVSFVGLGWHLLRTHAEIRDNRVEVVEGIVRNQIFDNFYARASGHILVDGRKFAVDLPVLLAFHAGKPYRLYVAAHTSKLLAAEPILESDPFDEREAHADISEGLDESGTFTEEQSERVHR